MGTAALGAAATAVGVLSKASITGFAEQEQLIGGVETLFGAGGKGIEEYAASVGKAVGDVQSEYDALMNAQSAVADNANSAYKTAGMSANEYMTTVTSFSASLLQSLGNDTVAAASKADMAITDMADNANKMGTGMDLIQNAYQGFAKQNYTMLDNLKLGYGGTKEEMQRLIDRANELNAQQGITSDYQIESYADIVDAIHVVQTEMGITGTTAKEAASTIQGSLSMAKSAWANWVTGLSDENADLSKLTSNLMESVLTVGQNIGKRLHVLVPRLTEGIMKLMQSIVPMLPGVVESTLPGILSGALALMNSLSNALPGLLAVIIPVIAQSAPDIIMALANGIIANLPLILESGFQLIIAIALGIAQALPQLVPTVLQVVSKIAMTILENIGPVLAAGAQLAVGLFQGLWDATEDFRNAVIGIWEGIKSAFSSAVDFIVELFTVKIPEAFNAVVAFIKSIPEKILEFAAALYEAGLSFIQNLIDSITEGFLALYTQIKQLVNENIIQPIKDFYTEAKNVGARIIDNVLAGLRQAWSNVTSWFSNVWNNLFGNLSVNVNANANSSGSTRAGGLDYVPYNGYPAILHREEAVLTASEARDWRSGNRGTTQAGRVVAQLEIPVALEMDGDVLAKKMYRFNLMESNRHGMSLVRA